jgi:hypothetical protein
MSKLQLNIKTLEKTQGQLDLENALRKGNGKILDIPESTVKEVRTYLAVNMSLQDIAIHMGMTERQVRWVRDSRRKISSLPDGDKLLTDKNVTYSSKSISVNNASYNYISSIKHLHSLTRGEVMDLMIKYIKQDKDQKFLKSFFKK